MNKNKRYTEDEDKYIISEVSKNFNNLSACFMSIAKELDRTPEAIHSRWYSKLSKQSKSFATIGYGKATINKKNSSNPTKVKKSIWLMILKLFKHETK